MRLEDMPTLEGEIERLKQQLSECQARQGKPQSAAVVCLLTTELDALKKQWQREALLEAAAGFVKNNQVDADGGWAVEELRRMAKELK